MAQPAEEHYRGEAGQKYQQQKRAVPEAAFPWVARSRAEKFKAHIKASDTVIELGAGLGWNLAELGCARRIATDLEDFLDPEVKKGGVEFLPSTEGLAAGTADVVICHHVLEHVADPPKMLTEVRRLLKERGLLLLHVPYEKERRYRNFDAHEPNRHLYSWNVQTLGNLVISQGFELREAGVRPFGYDRFAAKMAIKLSLGEGGFRLIRRAAHLLRPALEVAATCLKIQGGERA